jgi:hypothetical protein
LVPRLGPNVGSQSLVPRVLRFQSWVSMFGPKIEIDLRIVMMHTQLKVVERGPNGNLLGPKGRSQGCVLRLGPKVVSQSWVPLLGLMVGSHGWVPMLGFKAGSQGWVPKLGPKVW